MKFKKIMTGELEKCYSASSLSIKGKQKFLFASEIQADGIILDVESGGRQEGFPTSGGVMAMVEWPGPEGGFASVYGFYPPFQAEGSGLQLTVLQEPGKYASKSIWKLPYLHRFEVVRSENRSWLVLSVLCREKKDKDDWSSPGYVAVLPIEDGKVLEAACPFILLDGQFHNHGMWKGRVHGKLSVVTASDQGVFAFYPADRKEDWKVEKLLEEPCGEAVIFDLDGDGQDELITISPFHGCFLDVYQESEGKWEKIWSYPGELEFAHALWAGLFNGKRVLFCGHRKGDRNLLAVWKEDGKWFTEIVDSDVGSSNICVAAVGREQYLLSANHGQGQYAVYRLMGEQETEENNGGTVMGWNFSLPVKVEFGAGKVLDELGQMLKAEGLFHGLLISDPIFVENGLARKVEVASGGRISGIFHNIVSNPTVKNVDECAALVREKGYEFLVCLGGGSSLDCGKAVGSLCKTQDSIRDYMYGEKRFGKEHLPLIAIPTTAGTGSEVTMVAVITDEDSNKKLPVSAPGFYPDLAILDPQLTLTVPPDVTASCGIDVLSQALEGYWSRKHQPVCDACAIRACSLVLKYLERAWEDGSDLEARTAMCEASFLAGIAFATPKTSGPHVCSYPLTAEYHIPHGEACGMTLDSFLRLNADAEGGRLHELAKMLGKRDAYELADDILLLKKRLGLRCRLSEAGIWEEMLGQLVEDCHHPNMALNAVEVTDEILDAMFRGLL